jgi:2'-5' RNA ligase
MPSDPAAPARIRSFIAIDVTGPAREAALALLGRLRATGADVAWARPDALHVTLEFLGNVDPEQLARLGSHLAAIAARHVPLPITLAGVGAFPTLGRPRVLWSGIDAPALLPLAADVRRACRAEGLVGEERPFHPHLTLGRVRTGDRRGRRGGAAALPRELTTLLAAEREIVFGVSQVEAFILFRSDLGAAGARHTPLARYPLGGESRQRE